MNTACAVRYDQPWQEQFERLADCIGRQKAIVTIARKQLDRLELGRARHYSAP